MHVCAGVCVHMSMCTGVWVCLCVHVLTFCRCACAYSCACGVYVYTAVSVRWTRLWDWTMGLDSQKVALI